MLECIEEKTKSISVKDEECCLAKSRAVDNMEKKIAQFEMQ